MPPVKTTVLHKPSPQTAEAEQLVDLLVRVQSQLFDKAATYNNIVVSLGYAGFIAMWTWARGFLHSTDATIVALLLGTSLFLFVLFNVVTMFMISRQNIGLAKVLSTGKPPLFMLAEAQTFEAALRKSTLAYYGAWYIFFLVSSMIGFLSGAMLLVLIGFNLAGIDVGIHTLIKYASVLSGGN